MLTTTEASRRYIDLRKKELTSELAELDKLDRVLNGGKQKRSLLMDTPAGERAEKKTRKPISAKERKRRSLQMKAFWKAKKAGKKMKKG